MWMFGRFTIFLLLMQFLIICVNSEEILRLISTPASWNDAHDACKAVNGTLARIDKNDLDTLKDCPDLVENNKTYWSAGYNFLSPWFEFLGCYQIVNDSAVGGSSHDINNYTECYQNCKQSLRFGIQEGGVCICEPSEDNLVLTNEKSCLPCTNGSRYSCGTTSHLALYRPYLFDLDIRFCKLENNETCDCGVFQCEPGIVPPENNTWTYFSRDCSSKLQASCSDGNLTSESLDWSEGRQKCLNNDTYLSGPNIMDWCENSNATKRIPYWGHLHRDRVILYADTTEIDTGDLARIGECQYFSVIDDDVKLISTASCSQARGYICSLPMDQGHEKDCLIRTTTTEPTTTSTMTESTTSTMSSDATTTTVSMTTSTTTASTTTTDTPTDMTSTTESITQSSSPSPIPLGGDSAKQDQPLSDEARTGVIAGCVLAILLIVLIIIVFCNLRRKKAKASNIGRAERGRAYFKPSMMSENGQVEFQNDIERQPSNYPYKTTSTFASMVENDTTPLTETDIDQPPEGITNLENQTNDEEAPSDPEDDQHESPPTPCLPQPQGSGFSPEESYEEDMSNPPDEPTSQDTTPLNQTMDFQPESDLNDDDNFDLSDDLSQKEIDQKVEPEIGNEPVSDPEEEGTPRFEPYSEPEVQLVPDPPPADAPRHVSYISVVATKTENTPM